MVRIIFRSSNLKSDHDEYKDTSIVEKSCGLCDSIEEEHLSFSDAVWNEDVLPIEYLR